MRPGSRIPLVIVVAAVFATPAHAHAEFAALGGFWSGVVHFLTGFERPSLVVALAIWAGAQTQRADAALVAVVALGAFASALAMGQRGEDAHSAFAPAVVALALVGGAGAVGVRADARTLLLAAAGCGALAGAVGVAEETISDRALAAIGVSLAAAAAAAYGLVAASFVAPWRHARVGLRLCAAAGAIAAAFCALGHSSICASG
ncbi:hypothetical protein [Methylosinus sp. Sm6]|uniref:hypothetical protein n=1 Tax=Methylosinus sp. Sm6 TaxID=2866948 RepID=UPI001C9919D6|nr:hypothetical protein [Methylosinus sp. Sm6]MBY6241689.1 hypothetical protein [Methylosinus sp. Sm6]